MLGTKLSAIRRYCRTDRDPVTNAEREDTLLVPGATLQFPRVLSHRTDIRITYHYIRDHSNDLSKDFDDHVIAASLVYRFDTRQAFASPTK